MWLFYCLEILCLYLLGQWRERETGWITCSKDRLSWESNWQSLLQAMPTWDAPQALDNQATHLNVIFKMIFLIHGIDTYTGRWMPPHPPASPKGDRSCQCQSFHMLQLLSSIWYLSVTLVKAGKQVASRPELLQPLALTGALIFWQRLGRTVLCNTEIVTGTLDEDHLSTGYQESDCDNDVIKRWQWRSLC